MGTVVDVLSRKGTRVYSISPTATVLEATQLMNRHKIGSLVVTLPAEDSHRVVGMVTERDVLTRLVVEQRDPARTLVEDIMSTNVAYCRFDTPIDDVAAAMRERRIRHLPVCDGDCQLEGMVSIGDINAWYAQGQEVEIHYLHEYIYGRVYNASRGEGGLFGAPPPWGYAWESEAARFF